MAHRKTEEYGSNLEKAGNGKADHDELAKMTTAQSEQNIPWTFKRMIAVGALCIVYVGSQIILYFVSGGLTYISNDLKTQLGNWMLTANTLAVAAICPFVGYMTDLLGRRWICMFGTLCLIIASIVMATADGLGQAVAGMAVGGIGAGICELTALAG
jgi:MFS family permease